MEKVDWNKQLWKACKHGDIALAEEAIKNGADVNEKNKHKWSVLMKAAAAGRKKIVNLLVEAGADINAKDEKGQTALMKAAIGGHKGVIELLIKVGADINAKDNFGKSAYDLAIEQGKKIVYGNKKIVEILKEAEEEQNKSIQFHSIREEEIKSNEKLKVK